MLEVIVAKPILCFYYLTYRCNAKCAFCDIYQRGGPLADTNRVKQHLQELTSFGLRYIDFTGGEPLLHPDLPELLLCADKLGFHTTVTTNCILYPRRAQELKGLVDFLHFSLDAAAAERHNGLRGVDCYHRVMESLDIAAELGEKPDILMTVTQENFQQIDPLWEIARKRKLMLILNPVFEYGENKLPDRELAERMLRLPKRKYLYNNTAFLHLMKSGGNRPHHSRCKAVTAAVVISPQGELLLPCFHHAVVKLDLSLGIKTARRTAEFRSALQKQGKYHFCAGCAINCYFDPSFIYQPDWLFFRSMMAKTKYAVDKYLTS